MALRLIVSSGAAAAVLLAALPGAAQVDVNPQLPDVLLLVDNSGSMEYLSSSGEYPSCDKNSTASSKSRWIELQEVLTGTINDYRCQRVERKSAPFVAEYSINGIRPYDHSYQVPYHRPISGTCTPGPGLPPSNAFDFPDDAIKFHHIDNRNDVCNTWSQANDGLLDIYLNQVRFGLMTFDSLPDAGTGLNGTSPDPDSGMEGLWSYFLNAPARGKPVDCAADRAFEVGARNAGAPPWEGRLMAFGPPSMTQTETSTLNEQIQKVLLATRPYGATPINGMLYDARAFLTQDNTTTQYPGPANDTYLACRKRVVVLLTDGEPNTDMRPDCEKKGNPDGVCPYREPPEKVAEALTKLDPPIKTFVVGFAVSQVTLQSAQQVNCETMDANALNDSAGICAQNPDNSTLQACCTLNRIAAAGGSERAYFAGNKEALRQALNAIMADVLTETTSRTLPVFAVASTSQTSLADGFRFYSSFVPQQLTLWSGVLERKRIQCDMNAQTQKLELQIRDVDPDAGDDFAANVNSGRGPERRFISVRPDTSGVLRHPERTIRPGIGTEVDGVGNYSGTQYDGNAASFVTPSATPPEAMKIAAPLPSFCQGLASAGACSERLLKWLLGLPNGTIHTRCAVPDSLECHLLGDIYHSTPRVVGPPGELLRDETYENFALTRAERPMMLYTSTNDGLFHGFKVASNEPESVDPNRVDKKENNELWAFIPPAVLPRIADEYPNSHALLLDGMPVTKDVIAVPVSGGFRFERTLASTRLANEGDNPNASTWRTVLVQSFGSQLGGYFALDITDPKPTQTTGPKFLWQLTTDEAGNPLFGVGGGTPLITTVFVEEGEGESLTRKEVAVAVLPGGREQTVTGSCARATKGAGTTDLSPSDFPARSQVRCYSKYTGRALTIVRLDNGRILRQFRRSVDESPVNDALIEPLAPLDSPITGEPVAFPGATGAIADKVFVGDADGTMWRVDLSSPKPSEWTMALFLDAYSKEGSGVPAEPIVTPPVLSTDFAGDITVAFSTGDQDVFTASGVHHVFSATSDLDSLSAAATVNWYQKLDQGERVSGPITLFNGVLYYSTFKPSPESAVCQPDTSRVWAVDYVRPEDANDKAAGGFHAFPPTITSDQFIDSSDDLFGPDATIFGVSVAQLPSCVETESSFDSFYGSGERTRVKSILPSTFQLVMQVGKSQGNETGQKTNVVSIDLPTPSASPRIDSWAAIVE